MEELKKYEEKMNKTLVVLEEEFGAILSLIHIWQGWDRD